MPRFSVSLTKEQELIDRMEKLGVSEDDLRESFIRSSGPGGQKVNKTASCVFLVHKPTGLSVKCQQARSQGVNRYLARRLLLDRVERIQTGRVSTEQARIEKIRRQKRKRSKKAKKKVLEQKRLTAEKKEGRSKKVISDE